MNRHARRAEAAKARRLGRRLARRMWREERVFGPKILHTRLNRQKREGRP